MRYSIDTSAILECWVRWYPPDVFPSLWTKIDQLIDDGVLIASDEVKEELSKKDDEVFDWAKKRSRMFVPLTTEIQKAAAEILSKFDRLVDSRKDRSEADAFVIALAKVENCSVVTAERHSGTATRPRIPNVCEYYGIRCVNILQFIREQGWRF